MSQGGGLSKLPVDDGKEVEVAVDQDVLRAGVHVVQLAAVVL